MKAIVLEKTCTPDELEISEIPIPKIKDANVLVKVNAFGYQFRGYFKRI